ncbi:M16 family metallopeptidase [Hephaestia mangrovi]|uniref:M16 family metallopeptidase n=1 Tax=Hephaestia mangrovi TaxID=2873268 RepID=UPI001CA62B93|nr:pitrilysin family protein [Hephaestia mangrovi]MBY8829533.1 insulinase family protein [Hephaestia mangrovi]
MKYLHLLAAASLAGAFAPAARAEQPVLAQPSDLLPYTQFTLANGLRVVVHEDHATPKVAVTVWYHVGSMNEPAGKSGFAHLFEHLMFNGSEHHNKEYMPPLQEVGASAVNGATSFDQTYYYEVVPTGGLERALWLESDRMGHLLGAIDQAKLDAQRAVVQNEKRVREGQPYADMSEHELAGLFPVGHPYHHTTIGSMADLDAASLADVKAWFAQYYGAANSVVVLSGDVTVADARRLMEKYFGSVPAGPPISRMTAWVPTLSATKTEVLQDPVPQTAIAWDWPVPGRGTPDSEALRMTAQILGRGKTARLYRLLVHDKQIATSVDVTYQGYAAVGVFSIQLMLKDGVDPATAQAALKDALRDYLDHGPTPSELQQAKTTSYGDMIRSMESIYVRAMALADGETFANDPGRYLKDEQAFEALTADQVRGAADGWLDKPSYRLTVVPFGTHKVAADGADRTAMPGLAPSPALKLPDMQRATLANGIKVVFAQRTGTPTVEMTMAFDAGHAADQRMKPGLGTFTLGMMDEGTKDLSAQAFADRQAMLGTRIYTYGNSDTTDIQLSALTRNLPDSVALWADYIRNPGFRQADLDRLRALDLSGLSQSLSNPTSIAQRTFTHLLYGADNAYGTPLAGRAATLRSFTRDDVIAFHDSWLRPDNAVIYAAGDTTLPALVAALNKAFGDWTPPARAKGQKSLAPVAPATATRIVLIDKPGVAQSTIRVGQLMPSTLDARDFDINALNDVLGGNFTSRINMNIREAKGWTYGANSAVDDALGERPFEIATDVQTDKTAEAMTEIEKEVRDIGHARPITLPELDLMEKGEVLTLPGQFETNQALVGYMQFVDRFNRPDNWITTLPAQYEALTPDTITSTADAVLRPDALTWVVVGDLSKIESKIRALDLGKVEVWDAQGKVLR